MKDESLLRREHTWASPPLDGPDGASILTRSPGAGNCVAIRGSYCRTPCRSAHSPVCSIPYLSPPRPPPAAEGLGFCGPCSKPLSTTFLLLLALGQTPLLTLACLCCSGNPKGSRYPVLLVVPLHGNLSSGCWDSRMRKWNKLRAMALGHPGPWMPLQREGQLSLSHQSPL